MRCGEDMLKTYVSTPRRIKLEQDASGRRIDDAVEIGRCDIWQKNCRTKRYDSGKQEDRRDPEVHYAYVAACLASFPEKAGTGVTLKDVSADEWQEIVSFGAKRLHVTTLTKKAIERASSGLKTL